MRPALSMLRAAVLALLFSGSASAQQISISAQVNKTSLALNDQLVLTVTVSGNRSNLPEPELPPMPNFNIHSAGRSQNISFVNGVLSSSVEYRYILVPRFPGKSVLGPIAVTSGQQKAQTQPIEILVLRPSAQQNPQPSPAPGSRVQSPGARRQASPDLFVTAEVHKSRPYVNEEVLMTVRFYTGVPLLGNAEWTPPQTHGFLTEDLPPLPPRAVAHEGREYYVYELKMALYPAQSGALTIGHSQIRCQVQEDLNVDPFSPDFFQKFFSQGLMTAQNRVLRTQSITLTALPLPTEGKPSSFSGAVGNYRIKAEADKTQTQVGDAVNLTLTLEGAGNLKAMGDLALPEMASFRVYETVSSLNLQKDSNGVRGSKIFKTVLVPKVSGRLRVPPILFSYFDPSRKEYVTVQTAPLELNVAPGAPESESKPAFAPGAKTIIHVTKDIRHIQTSPRVLRTIGWLRHFRAVHWLHAIPTVLFLTSLGIFIYREKVSRDPAGMRFKQALARAQAKVHAAKSLESKEPQRAAGFLAEALVGYIADKLNCPASGLTLRQAQKLVGERFAGIPDGHLERLRMLWEELELFRFAPVSPKAKGQEGRHLAEGVLELLKALEEEMKP